VPSTGPEASDLRARVSEDCRSQPGGYVRKLAPWQERRAKEMIRSRLGTEIHIVELATTCRLSLSHFTKAFSNSVGTAPYRWIVCERVALSKTLLCGSLLTLAEIALECGFVDQSHFTNTFVRVVGMAPGRWRRACARMPDGERNFVPTRFEVGQASD
jgi:AraC family transcriptional regulator